MTAYVVEAEVADDISDAGTKSELPVKSPRFLPIQAVKADLCLARAAMQVTCISESECLDQEAQHSSRHREVCFAHITNWPP